MQSALKHGPFIKVLLAFAFGFLVVSCQKNEKVEKPSAPMLTGLGEFHRSVDTQSKLAQKYFDQGMVLFYSFEYGESIRSFRAAIKADSHCVMCYWGLALALGSKTAAPLVGNEYQEAKQQLALAARFVDYTDIRTQSYVNALGARYFASETYGAQITAGLCSSYSAVSGDEAIGYAHAMKLLTKIFPDDLEAKTLYAAALFDVTEWNFWDRQGQPQEFTLEIKRNLEAVLKQNPMHPGANHLYVHLMEFSPTPLDSLPSAEHLHQLVPVSEHMAHMPCHTYYRLGRYHDATLANEQAIQLYADYTQQCLKQGFQPEMQYLYYHNYDYLIAAASMEGRRTLTVATALKLSELARPLVVKNALLQRWLTLYGLSLARFGDWSTLLKIEPPQKTYQYALGMWHYTHGLAAMHMHDIKAAQTDVNTLDTLIQDGPVDKNLGKVGHVLLQIASYILHGVVAQNEGDLDAALANFMMAVKLQDELDSRDPPGWYFPVRQLLGMALLLQHRYSQAEAVFLQDLTEHPHNGWSLYGLMTIKTALGDTRAAKAYEIQFKKAWQHADIERPTYPIH